jgi:hypothetical protein
VRCFTYHELIRCVDTVLHSIQRNGGCKENGRLDSRSVRGAEQPRGTDDIAGLGPYI